jgi:hypothetical protein
MARFHYTFDADLELKDAGVIGSSAAAQVDSAAKVLDLGTGLVEGNIVVDVSALEIDSNDEVYEIVPQLTNTAAFATATAIQDAPLLNLSAKELKRTDSDKDDTTGRYIIPFRNEVGGTVYRYLRLYTYVAGTIAGGGGINYSAYLAKN